MRVGVCVCCVYVRKFARVQSISQIVDCDADVDKHAHTHTWADGGVRVHTVLTCVLKPSAHWKIYVGVCDGWVRGCAGVFATGYMHYIFIYISAMCVGIQCTHNVTYESTNHEYPRLPAALPSPPLGLKHSEFSLLTGCGSVSW